MIQMLMQAFVPPLYDALGIFIPLIVVNCIILARAEAFASKNNVVRSAMDGVSMGLGFTLALILISSIRELLGNGTVFGINLLGASFEPMLLMVLAPGGFIVFGLLLGIINAIGEKRKAGKEDKEVAAA
jgi:electron transport complex protein RnfE